MTVIEVLFSIGVVMIGLLGVAALLPVAGYQAAKGLTADRAAAAGRAAVEQFKVRGMGRQVIQVNPLVNTPPWRSMWLVPRPNNVYQDFLAYKSSLSWSQPAKEALAVCIDPRFVAANGAQSSPNFDARLFPYYPRRTPVEPRMRRITLRAVDPRVKINPVPMSRLQAEQIFTWSDDLSFELPEDRTLPPMQVYGSPGPDGAWGVAGVDDDNNGIVDDVTEANYAGSDDRITRRQYSGAVSWLATIAPKFDQRGAFRDLYVLSIVVFNHRDASMAMNRVNERIADLRLWGGGVGGGDVTLAAPLESDLDLQDGDWIMLAANMTVPGAADIPVFRWYRVLATDSEAAYIGPGQWTRNATLWGPDWDRPEWLPPSGNPNGAPAQPTVAALVTGVVAVYEKTIRLETASLWND